MYKLGLDNQGLFFCQENQDSAAARQPESLKSKQYAQMKKSEHSESKSDPKYDNPFENKIKASKQV